MTATKTNADRPKKNGQPLGKSTRWDNIQRRSVSCRPRSRSPPPPLGSEIPAPRPAVIVARSRSVLPVPSIGRADRSRSASLASNNNKRAASTQPRRPTPSPTPDNHPIAAHPIVRPQPKRAKPSTLSPCAGLYDGYFGAVLFIVGKSMLNTGRRLLEWAREGNAGVSSFKRSALAKSSDLLLLF